MFLAISTMDPTLMGVIFLVAVVLFVLAAVGVAAGRVSLIAAGLALVTFVAMWNAFAAA